MSWNSILTGRMGGREPGAGLRAAALLAGLLLLSGCYDVTEEFIGPAEGQAVPDLPGVYDEGNGGTTEITALPANEYHYRRSSPDGDTSSGVFRAVKLYDDVYLLQVRDESGALYAVYYAYSPEDGYIGLDVNQDAAEDLASSYGVELSGDFMELSGPPEKIRAFLFAHGPNELTGN